MSYTTPTITTLGANSDYDSADPRILPLLVAAAAKAVKASVKVGASVTTMYAAAQAPVGGKAATGSVRVANQSLHHTQSMMGGGVA